LRISILFKEPFWRSQIPGHYFMTDAFGGCCVYDESARHPCEPYGVLGWLLASGDAMALSNLDDQRLIRMALESLPESLRDGADLFVEGRVHRWIGTINGLPGGNPTHEIRYRHVIDGTGHPGLYLMGDYLFDSTVNGVYDSADFVTDMILTDLRRQKYARQLSDATAYLGEEETATSNGKAHTNGHIIVASADGKIDPRYHDYYYGDISYEEAFKENLCFNLDWTVQLIEAVWGKKPPYRVLDSGSANGLTIEEFAKAGIEAWGIENSEYIHAKTPAKLKKRNLLGDVRKLPFPDNYFDFVYDTCLAHVPPESLDDAVRELFRVCKYGVLHSGVTADMTSEVIEDYNLFQGVRSLYTLWEWSEIFMRNGFRMAVTSQKTLDKIWDIESSIEEDDWYWYPDPESMRYCFYSKPAQERIAASTSAPAILNGHVSQDYHDYYDGDRPYAESWKECFCEHYTTDLIKAIWGKAPPYTLLDCGSASGLTLEAFAKVGVDAWGIENSAYIHSQTPPAWRKRNLLGDVRELPFPDGAFDFVYDTCLCHVPEKDLDQAIREIFRVCRIGVFFGTFTADMSEDVTEAFDVHEGVHSHFTLAQWSKKLLKHGFQVATVDPKRLRRAWKIEVDANAAQACGPWYPDAMSMRFCFYSKAVGDPKGTKKKRASKRVSR
ncbi:MAG TPA: methyltransferase domain-containing protein, partial [Gemmataceae bacterium]|nr:methyltransferase domain-containing protein [Gemmataceae bacterium]